MQEALSQLVGLQKIDSRIFEIESVIKNMPLQIKSLQEKFEKAILGHDSIEHELQENKKAYGILEADISAKKDLLSSSQKKLTSVQNNKEYESVLRELESLKKTITEGDVKLKEMTNANFKYESELATIKELKASIEKQLEELSVHKKDEDKELVEELESLTKKREEAVKPIKKSVIMKYERVRTHRHNIGIASVKDEVCNGCYMHIPPQLYVDVKKDKAIYSCPHCQRILYYENVDNVDNGGKE